MKNFVRCALALALLPSTAFAYETKVGAINAVQVQAPAFSKRNVIVSLEGVAPLCNIPSNNESAYFNRIDSPDTFSAMLSTLLTAKATGRTVRLWTISGVEGCRLDRVDLL